MHLIEVNPYNDKNRRSEVVESAAESANPPTARPLAQQIVAHRQAPLLGASLLSGFRSLVALEIDVSLNLAVDLAQSVGQSCIVYFLLISKAVHEFRLEFVDVGVS